MSESDQPTGADRDHPGVLLPPPLLFLITIVAGLVLDWIWGASLGSFIAALLDWPGWIMIFTGIALMAISILQFTAAGTNVRPDQPVFVLVTSGIYSLSRNPIYVGMILLTTGIGLVADAPVLLMFLVPAVLILRYFVIAREEAYLEQKFTEAYKDYRQRTGRWFLGLGKD